MMYLPDKVSTLFHRLRAAVMHAGLKILKTATPLMFYEEEKEFNMFAREFKDRERSTEYKEEPCLLENSTGVKTNHTWL